MQNHLQAYEGLWQLPPSFSQAKMYDLFGQRTGDEQHVFRSARPFHPGRFWHFLQIKTDKDVVLTGVCWLASRRSEAYALILMSNTFDMVRLGKWWASMLYKERLTHIGFTAQRAELEARWSMHWADRFNEIVYTGKGTTWPQLKEELEACLLTAAEVELYRAGFKFSDPFHPLFSSL